MPYEIRGKCIYKKDGGAKVGCTKGDVHKYMAALHANANESIDMTTAVCPAELMGITPKMEAIDKTVDLQETTKSLIKRLIRGELMK
jgi:hypothetical protein